MRGLFEVKSAGDGSGALAAAIETMR